MTGIWDPAGVLAVAIAELPMSGRPAERPRDSVVIVPGQPGWGSVVTSAAQAGAAAILVVDPGTSEETHEGLLPIVVLRRRLGDTAPDPAPAAVVAEVAGSPPALEAAVRDTLGLIRVFGGGPVELRSHDATTGGTIALLAAGERAIPATLTVRSLSGVPEGAVIRVTALGVDRQEVVVDDAAGVRRPRRSGDGYESADRAALRRALRLAEGGESTRDLAELAADAEAARRILSSAG